jgi:hypothetical protein
MLFGFALFYSLLWMSPEMYQNVLKRSFPGHIDLELKPGRYVLRLGAIDRNSQKIGTVESASEHLCRDRAEMICVSTSISHSVAG